MGNNFSCNEFYCQNIEYKPEWFSENNYSFLFNNQNNNVNNNNNNNIKPYKIDKGIITLNFNNSFQLLISKKIDLENNNINEFILPINFSINLPLELSFFIIFSEFELKNDFINNNLNLNYFQNNNNIFYIKINYQNNNILININNSNKKYKGKIKNNKKYKLNINYLNNNNLNLSFNSSSKKIFNDYFFENNNIDNNIILKNKNFLNFFVLSNFTNTNQPYKSSFSFSLD